MASSINRSGGPKVRFDGDKAGIGISRSGDTSSPFNYSLICGCNAFLGIIGAFRPNAEGQRSCYCPKCKHAIILSGQGQVLSYAPYDITKTPPPASS